MIRFDGLWKAALVTVVLVVASGNADEKLATCCEKVNKNEITEPILGYLFQKLNYPCVRAMILQTESGLYCSPVTAPWVRKKISEFRAAKAKNATTSSPPAVSLLSIITSTTSAPPPSALPPSALPPSSSSPFFSSASGVSSGDSFSGSEEDESLVTFMTSASGENN